MKILIADDHLLVREGLKPFLATLDRHLVIVEAWDAQSLMSAVQSDAELDLALVDLHMPGMDGATSIARLRDASPSLPVIVLSGLEIAVDIEAVLQAGASGYIPKSSSAEIMVSAIRLVLAGGQYLPPLLLSPNAGASVPAGVQAAPRRATAWSSSAQKLSPRQREVVELLAQGLSNKMIAKRMGLVEGTVKSHLVQIFHLLGVRNRTSAVMAARSMLPAADPSSGN